MARPRRGRLKRNPTRRGISYGVAFGYRGREYYVHLGGDWEGWNEERAALEQRFLMEKVNRGEWEAPKAEARPVLEKPTTPVFEVEASEWLHRHKLKTGDLDGTSKTVRDLEWRLSVVMDRFGPVPIDQIDYALADELVVELCEERSAIVQATAAGVALKRIVNTRGGGTYETRRRSLANSSIRKALDAAERVLRDAKRRGALTGEVPSLKVAAPSSARPQRSFLEAEQTTAVLHAADVIEERHRGLTWDGVERIRRSSRSAVSLASELNVSDTLVRKVRRGELWNGDAPRQNRNDIPRRAIVETLILTGLRVSEACGLDGPDIDRRAGRIRVRRSATKTEAGERSIPIIPSLDRTLAKHQEAYPAGAGEPAFPTRNATPQHPDNVRARILAPIVDRANELLESAGQVPISHATPHTLRRTFASILAACDVPPRRAMYLMGHTNPTLTLAVYQQVLDMGKGSVETLEEILGCRLAEARAIYNGDHSARRHAKNNARRS